MIERGELHARFKDAPWYKPQDIIIGGCGGIGSWTSFLLSRADHNLVIYDFDQVELQNIGGQLFSVDHVGMNKAIAMKSIIEKFSDNQNVIPLGKYDSNSVTGPIVFSCFDNMAARKLMVTKWYEEQIRTRNPKAMNIFIDGRLEAETAIIYSITSKKDYEAYMAEFFDDSKVPDAPCTFRATSHNAAIIAGFMVSILNNRIANKLEGAEVREVPFKVTYYLPTLTFKS